MAHAQKAKGARMNLALCLSACPPATPTRDIDDGNNDCAWMYVRVCVCVCVCVYILCVCPINRNK